MTKELDEALAAVANDDWEITVEEDRNGMTGLITIGAMPEEVYRHFAKRAKDAGISIEEYLRCLFERAAESEG